MNSSKKYAELFSGGYYFPSYISSLSVMGNENKRLAAMVLSIFTIIT